MHTRMHTHMHNTCTHKHITHTTHTHLHTHTHTYTHTHTHTHTHTLTNASPFLRIAFRVLVALESLEYETEVMLWGPSNDTRRLRVCVI